MTSLLLRVPALGPPSTSPNPPRWTPVWVLLAVLAAAVFAVVQR